MGIQQYDGGNISNEEEYLEEEFCDLLHLGKLDRFKNLGGMNLEKFNKFISDGWNPCMLPAISENGWIGLSKFDIFSKEKLIELMKSTVYLCPFTTDETRSLLRESGSYSWDCTECFFYEPYNWWIDREVYNGSE